LFFSNAPRTPELYTLSLHDALPISFAPLEIIRMRMKHDGMSFDEALRDTAASGVFTTHTPVPAGHDRFDGGLIDEHIGPLGEERSEEHTSELQSRENLVCRLLLEKK